MNGNINVGETKPHNKVIDTNIHGIVEFEHTFAEKSESRLNVVV
jgi:hypothetical protein